MAWIRCTGNTGGSLKVRTASGAIATFETNMADVLQEVKCEINATGGNGTPGNPIPINGYTEANITRCGVNLWNEEWELGLYNSSTGEPFASNSYLRSKSSNYINVIPNTNYYICSPKTIRIFEYDSNYQFIKYTDRLNNILLVSENCKYIRFCVYDSSYGTTYNNDISINYPATDTDYHPYTGNTYTIAFGQTVYGGVLDVTRGKLKPCIEYPSYNGETLSGRWLSSEATYIEGTTPPTGSQVVSLDDYGSDIDLTPVQISALVGVNNVWHDGNGDTEVKYLYNA